MAQIALPLAIGSNLLSAGQTITAGNISNLESQTQAKQIELEAAQREKDRKEALASATASQAASSRGILFQGSPMTVLEEDIRKSEKAGAREATQAKLAADAARSRGKVAKAQSRGLAVTSLLDFGSKAAGTL